MVAVAERRGSVRKPGGLAPRGAADWRDLLLNDLCAGREGARLRRVMRAYHRKLASTRSCTDRRNERCAPRRTGYRARAARTLLALDTVRAADLDDVERHEARIRFALDRVDDARNAGAAPVRADRLRIALDILDHYIRRAEALRTTLDEDIESVVA